MRSTKARKNGRANPRAVPREKVLRRRTPYRQRNLRTSQLGSHSRRNGHQSSPISRHRKRGSRNRPINSRNRLTSQLGSPSRRRNKLTRRRAKLISNKLTSNRKRLTSKPGNHNSELR